MIISAGGVVKLDKMHLQMALNFPFFYYGLPVHVLSSQLLSISLPAHFALSVHLVLFSRPQSVSMLITLMCLTCVSSPPGVFKPTSPLLLCQIVSCLCGKHLVPSLESFFLELSPACWVGLLFWADLCCQPILNKMIECLKYLVVIVIAELPSLPLHHFSLCSFIFCRLPIEHQFWRPVWIELQASTLPAPSQSMLFFFKVRNPCWVKNKASYFRAEWQDLLYSMLISCYRRGDLWRSCFQLHKNIMQFLSKRNSFIMAMFISTVSVVVCRWCTELTSQEDAIKKHTPQESLQTQLLLSIWLLWH